MTYFFDAPNLPTGFLRYYSEIATTASRLVITLSAISFAGACDRYARCSIRGWDTISGFSGRRSSRLLSASVILLYAIALVVSVVEYPFEEQMYYASQRVKNWWDYPTTSDFDTALDTWHAANFFRLFCCIFAWLLVRIARSPLVHVPIIPSRPSPGSYLRQPTCTQFRACLC